MVHVRRLTHADTFLFGRTFHGLVSMTTDVQNVVREWMEAKKWRSVKIPCSQPLDNLAAQVNDLTGDQSVMFGQCGLLERDILVSQLVAELCLLFRLTCHVPKDC